MDQDTSRDPEPTPEPPEPPEDKGPRLEKAIYEEEIVDGFNFCSFETYPEVEECAKWIREYGKYPDPWYKLKFKPKEPKPEKKPKEKKEKKEKVKKEPKVKASMGSTTDKGYITSEGVGDLFSTHKSPVNGLKRPHGPLNFSLPHPGRHPAAAYPPQHYKGGGVPSSSHSPRSSGLYRPYESSPSPAAQARSSQHILPSHQNPAP